MDPLELATALKGLQEWAEANAPGRDSVLRRRIAEHLGGDPTVLPVVGEQLGEWERPNLQLALDAWGGGAGRALGVIGLSSMHGYRESIAELVQPESQGPPALPGPVEYTTVTVADRKLVCVASGLVLLRGPAGPAVALLRTDDHGMGSSLSLELMAPQLEQAEGLLAELQELMAEHNVFRGRVVQVSLSGHGGMMVEVRTLTPIARERIVLPPGVLERIERHTIEFGRHAERLRAAGRHLKRGLLLHGPPGTGKTLTAMYLAGQMPERTVVLLTGRGLEALGPAIDMARSLQPAMVVLEDVDLVAMDRAYYHANPLLFELLNQMDGLAEDADVVFVLTTNRPEGLETALAQRPGRVDQAVELPLPDAEGRRRLLDLYAEGLDLRATDLAAVVRRSEGASPAFIRELTRRGALLAVEEGGEGAVVVEERHLVAALDELQSDRERLTGALLGADAAAGTPPPSVPPPSVAAENAVELVDEEDDDEGWTAYGPTELR